MAAADRGSYECVVEAFRDGRKEQATAKATDRLRFITA